MKQIRIDQKFFDVFQFFKFNRLILGAVLINNIIYELDNLVALPAAKDVYGQSVA